MIPFLSSKKLRRHLAKAQIIKDSNIISDHLPILLEIRLKVVKTPRVTVPPPSLKKTDWLAHWADIIDCKIRQIPISHPKSQFELDLMCKKITEVLCELFVLAQTQAVKQATFVKTHKTTTFQVLKADRKKPLKYRQNELKKAMFDNNKVFQLEN